jgi:hypothetical protein
VLKDENKCMPISIKVTIFTVFMCLFILCIIALLCSKERIEAAIIIRNIMNSENEFDPSIWSKRSLERAVPNIIKRHERATYIASQLNCTDIGLLNAKIRCWNALLNIAEYVGKDSRETIEKYCIKRLLEEEIDDGAEVSNYRQYILSRISCCEKEYIEYYELILSDIDNVRKKSTTKP